MRIVLHAGLHKSGTTSVQGAWHAAFSERGPVWYPTRPAGRLPGHHPAVWPLMDAYVNLVPTDLAWARYMRGASPENPRLGDYVSMAQDAGVEVLLISTEELDRLQASDVPRFREILDGHDVTFLLTVTRPLQRWSSGWQTMVKHGLAQYPRDAAPSIISYAALGVGRVAELTQILGAERSLVRVVRTSPHEEDLPRQLAETVGVTWPEGIEMPPNRNVSLGPDVEVLRRMNEHDLYLGTMERAGRRRLRRLMESSRGAIAVPGLDERYAPPPEFWVAAEAEQRFLTEEAAAAGVEVLDPHGQLGSWTDKTPSEWYQRISESELDIPDLGTPPETGDLLWRVRQERTSLRVKLERAEQEALVLRRTEAEQQARIERLEQALELQNNRLESRLGRRGRRLLRPVARRLRR